MQHRITILPANLQITADDGTILLDALRGANIYPDAPCGGNGTCGKCRVLVDGQEQLACQTVVNRNMAVGTDTPSISDISVSGRFHGSVGLLAFDIGTTTVAGYLLDEYGAQIASVSAPNPQRTFGADLIARIRYALTDDEIIQTQMIRLLLTELTRTMCEKAGITPDKIQAVSIAGNPAMQQLFLGISPKNLAQVPYAPVLTDAQVVPAKTYLPVCENADLLIIPNIGGFVGGDTVAGILSSGLDQQDELTLLVDIGTNGELVLGSRHRMAACSTAAGPALEGANIQFGMRAETGAIDHVWLEQGQFRYHVLGSTEAIGICGSGLIDAVAAALDAGLLDSRGRILNELNRIDLTERVYLTQEDIRQVQLAKGALAAGIHLLAAHLEVALKDIRQVYLAGAFGFYLDKGSACRIGLLPPILEDRTKAIGNAAGTGAMILAGDIRKLDHAQQIAENAEFVELASLPEFRRCFADQMRFLI